MIIRKNITLDVPLYMTFLHQEISSEFVSSGTDIKKQRIVKVAAFLVVVVTGI